ncbi:ACP S-malonyltransferase [Spirillospora albida]|uniref:ACP S-malonyltransferase n=1 Tax=Spirillospora albida TaxID=58123 RepID=UPI0004C0AA48|nr:ACP S-malonyltransferase [Spirillospora albida]
MNELVIVFPGQGSQFVGMGKKWFAAHESVRERFRQASDILGYSLEDLCFEAEPKELTRTRYAQVSLLVVSYAMYEAAMREVASRGRKAPVSAMTGHSLGEITALLAAGAVSFEDAVRLVKVRGEAMEVCAADGSTGMIAAMGMPVADLEKCVEDFNAEGHDVQVSNYNTDTQTVLSGTLDDLKSMTSYLEERDCRVAKLNVAGAFHSTFMATAVPAFVEAIEKVGFTEPDVPVYSGVTGRAYGNASEIKDALAVQLTSPVRWSGVVSALADRDVRLWIEVGPKQVLKKMIAGVVGEEDVLGLDEDPERAYQAIDRLIERRRSEPGLVGLCMGAVAATRNRNFDDDAYTEGVIVPYRRLQELDRIDKDELTDEQKRTALDLLFTIMKTKQVPEAEQQDRVRSILRRTGDSGLRPAMGASAT